MNLNKYEKTVTYRTIFLTIIRRFHIFLIVFLPIVIISFLFTHFLVQKTYQSTIVLNRNGNITSAQYQVMQKQIKEIGSEENPSTIYCVYQNLKKNDIKHSDGREITTSEIQSGISFSLLDSNSIYFSFYFKSKDLSIVKPVSNELALNTIQFLKDSNKTTNYTDFKSLSLDSVSDPVKNSKETTYFLIFSAIGFAAASLISLIYEVVGDEVFNKKDLEYTGINISEINLSKTKLVNILYKKNLKIDKIKNALLKELDNDEFINKINSIINDIKVVSEDKVLAVSSIGDLGSTSSNVCILLTKAYDAKKSSSIIIDGNPYENSFEHIKVNNHHDSENKDKELNKYNQLNLIGGSSLISFDKTSYPCEMYRKDFFSEVISDFKDVDHFIICVPSLDDREDALLLRNTVNSMVLVTIKNVTKRQDVFNAIRTCNDKGIIISKILILK